MLERMKRSKSPPPKGSRGRPPQRMTAQGRGGETRDAVKPVAERSTPRSAPEKSTTRSSSRRYGTVNPAAPSRRPSRPPVIKAQPMLKRVQLDAPPPQTMFTDMDGEKISFPESNLRRVAAKILSDKRKAWRYRAFSFPLFTDKGNEQSFQFDFYVYDYEETMIRLILVVPHESREVWDRVGRFKRQYPMYTYELWTPEKLAALSSPRGKLGF